MTALVVRRRSAAVLAGLLAANLAAWGWAWAAFHGDATLLGMALLAYSFGLRHAVDADHLAAIDNVTRKLMQQGQRPTAVGFFFAMGHSSVVLVAATLIAASGATLQHRYPELVASGSTFATAVSAAFLLAIAAVNGIVLLGIYRLFGNLRRGAAFCGDDLETFLARRGLVARLLRRLFRLITRSWHMYPLGLLFGLGFDTASEIGLLGIAASQAAQGLPIWSILVFPALFTAGMSLIDTADGLAMLGAYGWAFADPARKLLYNLAITGFSVAVAALIGGIEAFGLVADRFGLAGGPWDAVSLVNDNLGMLGCLIIAAFGAGWLFAVLVYRLKGYAKLGA